MWALDCWCYEQGFKLAGVGRLQGYDGLPASYGASGFISWHNGIRSQNCTSCHAHVVQGSDPTVPLN